MTKKMLQGIATGIFLAASILCFSFYFTDQSQVKNESISFSEQDMQAYLEENNLITVNQSEYDQLLTQIENLEEEPNESQREIQDTTEDFEAKEVIIVINPGMSSGSVSLLLEEKGLIDDKQEFADYLINNQLDTKIKAGEFKLSSEMTIEEIANSLT